MNTRKIKVVVGDDTLIAREGWKKILESVDDIEVIGEITTAQETFAKVKEFSPDILLMDLLWFGDETAGTAAIEQIKREIPQIKIIAITAYRELIASARRAGAEGALSKGFSKSELVNTIRAIYQLEGFPQVTSDVEAKDELSDREKDVLVLISHGLTDKEIASKLIIAEGTVKNHVSNIINKLNVTNRTEAVTVGFRKGILK